VHGHIAKGADEVRALHTLFILQKRFLEAIYVGKQGEIGAARVTIGIFFRLSDAKPRINSPGRTFSSIVKTQ
jgi:hypothetical protein